MASSHGKVVTARSAAGRLGRSVAVSVAVRSRENWRVSITAGRCVPYSIGWSTVDGVDDDALGVGLPRDQPAEVGDELGDVLADPRAAASERAGAPPTATTSSAPPMTIHADRALPSRATRPVR